MNQIELTIAELNKIISRMETWTPETDEDRSNITSAWLHIEDAMMDLKGVNTI